jgi:hypothetical protein
MESTQESATYIVSRLLAMAALALLAFGVVLTVGLAGAGSALELALGAAMVGLVIAAALACLNASVQFCRPSDRPRDRVYYLVPERVKR